MRIGGYQTGQGKENFATISLFTLKLQEYSNTLFHVQRMAAKESELPVACNVVPSHVGAVGY